MYDDYSLENIVHTNTISVHIPFIRCEKRYLLPSLKDELAAHSMQELAAQAGCKSALAREILLPQIQDISLEKRRLNSLQECLLSQDAAIGLLQPNCILSLVDCTAGKLLKL